ncbi:receptor-like serine/threonine-protein kinase SD1-8 [Impatiens glandulifera]|uniref:receptor-like serine/threonine-protein kinase SD1-8 n=1 Tax=Impatiens glandulifera TaxID=253017 RepID=UPI001FB0F04D|nr:receptor-like serine/threonine-protein kinase SD1-8 [Impatiens glandulifera]
MENTPNFHGCFLLILCLPAVLLSIIINAAPDTITPTQPLTSSSTLVSAAGKFELGFFSPGNSGKLYVGVWYKDILPVKTIAWVLNRDNPLDNSSLPSALLQIAADGNLVLTLNNSSNPPLWSSNSTTSTANTVAQLLDSGNLVLRPNNNVDPTSEFNYIWQGFDHPTDTLLPGMKLGWDLQTGLNRFPTSWKSPDDPSTGDFSFKLDINGSPEAFLWNKQQRRIYRSGPWNGEGFNGVPGMKPSTIINFNFVRNSTEVAYSFLLLNQSLYSRLTVTPTGILRRFAWIDNTAAWKLFWYAPADQCDNYMECGVYGICDTSTSPVCNCPKGFRPKNYQAWNLRDGSDGCYRKDGLNCPDDGFLLLNNMKMPDTSATYVNDKMSLAECDAACRKNCSCMAYANTDIRFNGSGCAMWTGDLLDMRMYASSEGGQALYLRVSASDVEQSNNTITTQIHNKRKTILVVSLSVGFGVVLVGLLFMCLIWKRRKAKKEERKDMISDARERRSGPRERSQDMLNSEGVMVSKREYSADENTTHELDLPFFDFGTITTATNNYSDANKLGQGGFGCVYKGMLVEGQTIAVKRLSKNSGQGVEEFKNEMRLIARLQHRNLVRLLGCCVYMEEKMLIYEFMENKSLDSILFNKERCSLLDWKRRFDIICGIARGLLYLHQDSRFRIIHRDLKASNILLDKEMNPKISDFGMARIFGTDQTEANTRRVVGTYGYMSPEYAMDGLFSIKSDVFSFGVLVLEIISGKKNRGFYTANQQLNLLGHAWRLWREGKGMELLDPSAGSSYSSQMVSRCIQVGLLCVQERAEDRPTMANVVLMLSSESMLLSQPRHPGFCLGRHHGTENDTSSSMIDESATINNVTVTILDGR